LARYWLGPRVWDTVNLCWTNPANVTGVLDLRTQTQRAATVTPVGNCFFVTANATNLNSDYTNLGTDQDAVLSGQQKASWESRFGFPSTMEANTLRQAIWETCTTQADPSGEDRIPPFIPTVRRVYELWVANQLVIDRPFSPGMVEWANSLDRLRRRYRLVRQRCLDGLLPATFYRKLLGYWVRKYLRPYREFQYADLPDESDLPPETTLTDNFNRTDSTNINTGAPFTWAEVVGTARIISNALARNTLGPRIRAQSDLSGDDHYSEGVISILGVGTSAEVLARYDSAADNSYGLLLTQAGALRARSFAAGTPTNLGAGTAETISIPDTIKLEVDGSSLRCYFNGALTETVSDSTYSGQTRCGLSLSNTADGGVVFDECTFADLAVAGNRRRRVICGASA
jgi:hypothetical protein